tara:strand:+ start:3927 stop:4382 length:456 start_codon:yes stop_codon:yes gene_type:complete
MKKSYYTHTSTSNKTAILGGIIALMLIFMSVTSDLLSVAEYIVSAIAVIICILTYESVTSSFEYGSSELVITRQRIFGNHQTVIQRSDVTSIDRMQKGKKKKPFITTVVSYTDNGALRCTCGLVVKDFIFSDKDDGELYRALIDWKVREQQ